MRPIMPKNIPLDSHILIDTNYIRQYLNESPDLILDDIDDDSEDALTDVNDSRFNETIEQVVTACIHNNQLHDKMAEAVHESWLWEPLTNIIDDITVDFMVDEIARIKNQQLKETNLKHALAHLIDALCQGSPDEIDFAVNYARTKVNELVESERSLKALSTSSSENGRIAIIEAQNPID